MEIRKTDLWIRIQNNKQNYFHYMLQYNIKLLK